jgi:hypothetical protein
MALKMMMMLTEDATWQSKVHKTLDCSGSEIETSWNNYRLCINCVSYVD